MEWLHTCQENSTDSKEDSEVGHKEPKDYGLRDRLVNRDWLNLGITKYQK